MWAGQLPPRGAKSWGKGSVYVRACVCMWDFHVVVAWLLRKILCLIGLDQ